MTIRIPHSIDALVVAVEALANNRPMPDDWSKDLESPSVVEPMSEPVPESPSSAAPAPAAFDEALLVQAISDLIDKKVSNFPQPKEPDLQPIQNRLQQLENADLERRVAAIEAIITGMSIAIHKEGAA